MKLLVSALENTLRKKYHLNVLFGNIDKNPNVQGFNQWCDPEKHQNDDDIKELFRKQAASYKNYGFATGHEGLVGFDLDWIWVYERAREYFKERLDTFTVRTPNEGMRILVFSEQVKTPEKYKVSLKTELHFKKYNACYGEAKKDDGSTGKYEIVKDTEIKEDKTLAKDFTVFLSELLEKYKFLTFPCLKEKLPRKKNHLTHEQRLAISNFLIHAGIPISEAAEFFSICPDYDKTVSEYQISDTAQRIKDGRLKPPTCESLKSAFGWYGEHCKGCPRKKKVKNEILEKSEIAGRGYHETDLGNAQRLVAQHGEDIRFCHPWNSWLVWNGKKWETDNTAEVVRRAKKTVIQMYAEAATIEEDKEREDFINFVIRCESQNSIKSMIELSKSEDGIYIIPEKFDADKWLFCVQNGTIDLRTGELREHKRGDYITKISPVTYDQTAKAPIWEKFLDTIFEGNQNIIEYIQRKCGYILTGITREEDLDILYGTGGNGKGKLTGALIHVMGDYHLKANVETIQETNQKNGSSASSDVAALKGARLVSVSEPPKGIHLNESRVKDLTGRDPITARRLYQEQFTFLPEFKLWIYTNYKPIIKGQDRGIWRRIKLIPFDVTIPDEIKDVNIDIKLQSEASGILNWCIEGCQKWQKDGLKVPNEILEAVQEYKEEMDVFSDFFELCCDIDKNVIGYNEPLYFVYKSWCNIHNYIPYSQKKFSANLEERGFKKIKKDMYGVRFKGMTVKRNILDKYNTIKSQWVYGNYDGMTDMTQFLETFLREEEAEKVKGNSVISVIKHKKEPIDNDFSKKNPSCDQNYPSYPSYSSYPSQTSNEEDYGKKKASSCGICGNPLNGNTETIGSGIGTIHTSCKFTPIKIRFLKDIQRFIGIDNRTYGTFKTGDIADIPIINAQPLITKHAAERYSEEYEVEIIDR